MGVFFEIKNENRKLHFSSLQQFVSSALAAEAWVLRETLLLAIDNGFDEIQMLSDSQSLVSVLNSYETHTEIHSIVNDIRQLTIFFSLISFCFIPRSVNDEADSNTKDTLRALMFPI
ncbi:hypothetical protein EUTSA_v10000453mg [Eutrema salsugineum]|uniref:RNase H type-1 domain-containing protein n=1 Tax=Eutrema salsugineum TaxID=72664 RepID=V4L7K3_EUTSA|nr:hypothetical protein EUTSA_v10000453mg [Eutrema salsugineum]